MRLTALLLLFITLSATAAAQFIGLPGIYHLGSADIPVPASRYADPAISGVVCRVRWETFEPSPGHHDWTFIDGEVAKARAAGSRISLQPLGQPAWLRDSLGVRVMYSIDDNPNHRTFGLITWMAVPWDSTYIRRLRSMIDHLAERYATDPVVAYVNLVGGQLSRNLPDTVLTDTTSRTRAPMWTTMGYDPAAFAGTICGVLDHAMSAFPTTPIWCSIDYVTFERHATGNVPNHLASLVAAYGVAHHPDRFGAFREDVSGCTPYEGVNPGSQWALMKAMPCRTGAQMLWSVQDGPTRMNKCGIVPSTKSAVLDSAIGTALRYGMRYLEIYAADIEDASLHDVIARGNDALILQAAACSGSTSIPPLPATSTPAFHPHPVVDMLTLDTLPLGADITIIDVLGHVVLQYAVTEGTMHIPVRHLPAGVWLLRIASPTGVTNHRFIRQN